MKVALLSAPKFKDSAAVKRILELRGWSLVKSKPDYSLTIGGDGSVLYAESRYPGTPIIALKSGQLGFLTCEVVDQIESVLKAVEKKKITLEKRNKLEFAVGDKKRSAMNEVLITSSVAGKALRLDIEVGKEHLGYFVCDGVLVSTPTGSTGYNLSSGGPIIEPGTPVSVLTLINAHRARFKSLVLPNNKEITVSFSRENPGITVIADGIEAVKISHKQTVKIRKSKQKATLVRIKKGYYSSLESLFT